MKWLSHWYVVIFILLLRARQIDSTLGPTSSPSSSSALTVLFEDVCRACLDILMFGMLNFLCGILQLLAWRSISFRLYERVLDIPSWEQQQHVLFLHAAVVGGAGALVSLILHALSGQLRWAFFGSLTVTQCWMASWFLMAQDSKYEKF
eukprot:NODE_3687_length_641_cov_317.978041_g2648_i0.p1 GENE.NODE_3687_length_641_cov_317.978041_g2648_i0~~NODE_3687_length_641_cov_317.978041_g2648_i0.p1  ORF type:complete len:165 (-),score=26.53 NODE_3687_length_641_cov_317.978041_g2648_i0:146-592(-)